MVREEIELVENVSGPAKAAASATRALGKAFVGLFSAMAGVPSFDPLVQEVERLSRAAAGLKGTSTAIKALARAQAELNAAQKGDFSVTPKLGRGGSSAGVGLATEARRTTLAKREQTAAERELARAMAEEARLAAKLQTFDAGREKRVAKMRSDLRAGQQRAKGKAPGDLGPALPRTLEPSLGGIATIAGGIVASKVADAAGRLAAAAGDLAIAGAKLAIEMASFKDDTLDAMTASLGSAKAAEKAFSAGLNLANEIGGKPTERLKQLRELLGKGFSTPEALDVIRALADLQIRLPDLDANALQDALAKLANKGELSSRALLQLNDVGFSTSEIMGALAKKLGKTTAEVEALVAAGKVSGKDGIAAVLELVKAKTGESKIGDIARKNAADMGVLIQRLQSVPEDIFLRADLSKGAANVQAFTKAFLDLVGPGTPLGDKLVRVVEDLADAASSLLGGAKGAGLMAGALSALADTGTGVAKGMKDVAPILDGMIAAIEQLTGTKDSAEAMQMLGRAAVYVTVAFAGLAAAAIAVSSPILYLVDQVASVISQLEALSAPAGSAGSSIGTSFVRGMLAALTGGISEIFFAGQQLASAAGDGTKAGGQVHSPSRLMYGIGEYFPLGMANAITDGVSLVGRAGRQLALASAAGVANSNGLAAPAAVGGGAPLAGGASSAVGGGATMTIVNNITIGAGAPSGAGGVAEAAARGATQGTEAALESWLRRKAAAA